MDYNTFAGKIKSADCSVSKLDIVYNYTDCRCWSAIVNQGSDNIVVTYNVNRSELGSQAFDIFSSTRILTDVEPEDIYSTIEYIRSKPNISIVTSEIEPLIEE
jgi:hypothetical protein